MSLFIARHAETPANAGRVFQQPDTPLSSRGISQAKRLADHASNLGISKLIASDYLRTRQTAESIADRCGVGIEWNPLLRERNFGDLRGMPYDLLDVDPFAEDYVPPNGESWQDFDHRVLQAWRQIQEVVTESEGVILVVTHGLVCRSIYRNQCHGNLALGDTPAYANTALTEIEAKPPWKIIELNSVSHLQGEQSDVSSTPV